MIKRNMRQSNKIQKSLRLDPEIVNFIESQPGRDFSSKFLHIIELHMADYEAYEKRIEEYDLMIQVRREELNRYYDLLRKVRSVTKDYEDSIRRMQCQIEELTAGL